MVTKFQLHLMKLTSARVKAHSLIDNDSKSIKRGSIKTQVSPIFEEGKQKTKINQYVLPRIKSKKLGEDGKLNNESEKNENKKEFDELYIKNKLRANELLNYKEDSKDVDKKGVELKVKSGREILKEMLEKQKRLNNKDKNKNIK